MNTCSTCACDKVCDHDKYGFENCDNYIPVDVAEVKHGHWIKRGNEKKCSVCEFIYYSNNDDWNGCPNCLARMDGQ